jgi:subtilase family serine protease
MICVMFAIIYYNLLLLNVAVFAKVFSIDKPLPADWSAHSVDAKHDTKAQFRLALESSNKDKLQSLVESISDPNSKKFHKYLTNDDLAPLLQPSQKNLDLLYNWVRIRKFTYSLKCLYSSVINTI